jgi:glycosyltransferase involved in cell wall biosynthesis
MIEQTRRLAKGGRRLLEGERAVRPLVSIVTVVFRARQELIPLLESILAFSGDSLEIIVIDAGSEDGTIEVLQELNAKIDYWVSEPDEGIYDAMNKGVSAASGEYILHLNAGDRLRLLPHQELGRCLADNVDVACFAVDMEGFGIHRPRTGFIMRFTNSWHHQGTFYRRASHLGYKAKYRVYGDFDLNQRMMKAGKSVRLFGLVVAQQATVGVSANKQIYKEQYTLIRSNFGLPYVWLAFIWRYVSPIIPSMKRWIEKDGEYRWKRAR